MDSRFRGNDRGFEGGPIPNDTNTEVLGPLVRVPSKANGTGIRSLLSPKGRGLSLDGVEVRKTSLSLGERVACAGAFTSRSGPGEGSFRGQRIHVATGDFDATLLP